MRNKPLKKLWHFRLVLLAIILILLIVPVLTVQLYKSEGRSLRGVELEDTKYTEINFQNTTQNIHLGGMLFVPQGQGPFPAVVIIHGSGTSNRENRWYLTLTQYLQDHGIVVLLPDKRGSERSQGDWHTSNFADLATDTLAALQFLQDQDLAAISQVGIVGMSQGGWIAPLVASQSSEVTFLVNVVGAAVSTHEQLLYEENNNLREMGFFPGISNLIAYLSTAYLRNVGQREFWDAIGDFDPLPYWQQLTVSSLVLYGQADSNVPSVESAVNLRSLESPHIQVMIYEGSGHALEDPVDQGSSIFREDALRSIMDFVLSASTPP